MNREIVDDATLIAAARYVLWTLEDAIEEATEPEERAFVQRFGLGEAFRRLREAVEQAQGVRP